MNKKNSKISKSARSKSLSGASGAKNIFSKTTKFIFSRLFFLVIGIFLAIGATYVYATWDDAKTGGSGQLTEANWNALVAMLENNTATERGTDNAALASNYTAARATKIDNLDATVSSRLSAAAYTTERGTDNAALDSEVGNATDAASLSTTLFAGQQYISDNMSKSSPTFIYETSTTHNGNFGGRSGLDAFCRDYKPSGLTCGNIHAFISVSTTDEIRDMPLNYGYDFTQPVWWFKTNGLGVGTRLGTSWTDILDSSIETSEQTGTGIGNYYWTGSNADGSYQINGGYYTCYGWTNSGAYGWMGYSPSIDGSYLAWTSYSCNNIIVLLCACSM